MNPTTWDDLFKEAIQRGLTAIEAAEIATLGMKPCADCTEDDFARFDELNAQLKQVHT